MAHQFQGFSQTKPYYRDDIVWCVKSAEPLPSWLKIFAVFNNASVALIVTLLFISCCVVWFAFAAFDPKPLDLITTFITGYHIMLCLGNTLSAKRTTTRIYLFFCMICSMLVSLHYLSFYTAFMIHPRLEGQIVFVNELMAKEVQLTGDLETLSMVNKSGKVSSAHLWRLKTRQKRK